MAAQYLDFLAMPFRPELRWVREAIRRATVLATQRWDSFGPRSVSLTFQIGISNKGGQTIRDKTTHVRFRVRLAYLGDLCPDTSFGLLNLS